MRNLKRALSLALASIMVLGLMVVGASAASFNDFTDKDEIKNSEAVNTMVSLGVISGKSDGSYDPTGSLTRAEACTLIARMLGGGKDPILGSNIKSNFKDTQGHWAENYIAYCANLGIIAGVGDGNFKPDDTLTGSAAAKMVLCALGYKPEFEGIGGANWELATNTLATKIDLYNGLETLNPSATISRDDVAQLIYNGVQAQEVEYRNLQGDYSGTLYATENGTMLANRFGVVKVEGVVAANEVFGISYGDKNYTATQTGKTQLTNTNTYGTNGQYNYDGVYPISMSNDLVGQRVVIYVKFQNALSPNASSSTVLGSPIVSDKTTVVETYSKMVKTDDVKDALKGTGISMPSGNVTTYTYTESTSDAKGTSNGTTQSAGVHTRFIDNNGDGTVDLIIRDTAGLSKVSVYNEKDEKLTLSGIGSVDFEDVVGYKDVVKGDYVLVTKYDSTYVVSKVNTVEGKVTAYNSGSTPSVTIDGTKYAVGAGANKTTDLTTPNTQKLNEMVNNTYRLYLDAAGNMLAYDTIDEAIGNYAVVLASGATTTGALKDLSGQVKLLLADGTKATYNVNLLASAKKWGVSSDADTDAKKEAWMAETLDGASANNDATFTPGSGDGIVNTIVSYTVNDDGTVTIGLPNKVNSNYNTTTSTVTAGNLNRNTSTYTFGNVKVVADDSTIFFLQNKDGSYAIVTGLSNLSTSDKAFKAANSSAVYYVDGAANVAKAMYLELNNATYSSAAKYLYITGNYSYSVENSKDTYTYPVVFEDGTTGTVKSTVSTYAKNTAYEYTTDSNGYVECTSNNVVSDKVVTYVSTSSVAYGDITNDAANTGSKALANGVAVWNVEDSKSVYDTNMAVNDKVELVLDENGAVKLAFVEGTQTAMTAPIKFTFNKEATWADANNNDTLTVTFTKGANQTVKFSTKAGDAAATEAAELTSGGTVFTAATGDSAKAVKVTITVSEDGMTSRVYEYNFTVTVV